MSRTISFTVPDAMYDALIEEAAKRGQQGQPGQGKGIIARQAIRYWLAKNGHKASFLDLDDKSYREHRKSRTRPVPGTRKPGQFPGTVQFAAMGTES